MMTVMLLILAAILAIMPATAQPQPVECPLPPYQLPLLAPERAFVDEAGDVVISGVDTPFNLPDGLRARQLLWSDDGKVLLVLATDRFFVGVFAYKDGEMTQILTHETLMSLRTEDFRDAVSLMNPQFVPGTHTVLFNTEVSTDAEGIYFEIPLDLWSLDLDTGILSELLPYGEAGQFYVAPDGQSIVLMAHDTIRVTDTRGRNPVVLFEGAVAIGLGESVMYPELVWDAEAEVPTFRTLLTPYHDPNTGRFDSPFVVYEVTLGSEPAVEELFSGQQAFFPSITLSPDGYRVAEWRWQDPANPKTVDLRITSADGPSDEAGTAPVVLTTFDVPQGVAPFVQWDDATHIRYGYFVPDGRADWRIDLCGEIVELVTN